VNSKQTFIWVWDAAQKQGINVVQMHLYCWCYNRIGY